MQNILILGLGAFGFAIAKYLGENNPEIKIYATEVNLETYSHIEKNREQPYFFPGAKLPENVILIQNIDTFLPEIDIIISVIPCQFLAGAFQKMKNSLKDGVCILNLSKGINNQTLKVPSETLQDILVGKDYSYAYLAGGMIAQELLDGKPLGADIVCRDEDIGEILRGLFQGENLDIHLIIGSTKNTELYAALKNIIALILGYHEGKGYGASSLGKILVGLLKETELLIEILDGDTQMRFTDYALGGDIIATCFGASRNRLLGNMLGEGTSISQALEELASQKKIAEGYETLKGVYILTKGKEEFELINDLAEKYL